MNHPLPPLTRGPLKERPGIVLMDGAELAYGRAHEAIGNSRRLFALWLASKLEGPVFWIVPRWSVMGLNPEGVADFIEPQRLTMLRAPKEEDILWCMEEALGSGGVPLVVGEPSQPPALTPVRRLHMAAERTSAKPIGLILSSYLRGAQGVETRWRMDACMTMDLDDPLWTLSRTRARTAPPKTWHLGWVDEQITVQSEAPPPATG